MTESQGFHVTSELTDLKNRIEEAKANISEPQRAFLDGKEHFFMRLFALPYDLLLILGRTVDIEAEGSTDDSLWYNLNEIGMAYTEAYSTDCPEGEYGDTHIATVLEITKDEFDLFKGMGWSLDLATQNPVTAQIIGRWIMEVAYQ